jgi:N-acetyl-gamma-glutamyl-phosphate reductase
MSNKIKAGIVGGAGYTGGELLRLLINHPQVQIDFVHSNSNAEKPIASIHSDLAGEIEIQFTSQLSALGGDIDVLFLCVGHGDAKKFLQENVVSKNIRIIDLSQDFRLASHASFGERNFVYGLPELNKAAIASADNIANPGCFATAIQLGLLPLAQAGVLGQVYCTGITGSTGAGQGLAATSHFSWRVNNVQAYKTLQHQHLKEISQSLHQLQHSFPLLNPDEVTTATPSAGLHFVPWRGDFSRGIFISSQLNCDMPAIDLIKLYQAYFFDSPFVTVSSSAIHLKQVVNTNKCMIQLEQVGGQLVVHSAIDNLLKGASGQAVQNMNLMFGIDETIGLKLKAAAF